MIPFRDARFRRLLLFGCWFSFFNGITQSAQSYYSMHVLGISLFISLSLQTGMNLGQWGVSPWLGRLADRWGNRPVMFVSQLLVAAGMLFFAVATPEHWEWIIGAWVLWIAYAGLNLCLPNLMLKLARARQTPLTSQLLRPHADCASPPAPSSAARSSIPARTGFGL